MCASSRRRPRVGAQRATVAPAAAAAQVLEQGCGGRREPGQTGSLAGGWSKEQVRQEELSGAEEVVSARDFVTVITK